MSSSPFKDPAELPEGWQRDLAELYSRAMATYGAGAETKYAQLLLGLLVGHVAAAWHPELPTGCPDPDDAALARAHTEALAAGAWNPAAPAGSRAFRLVRDSFSAAEALRETMLREQAQG